MASEAFEASPASAYLELTLQEEEVVDRKLVPQLQIAGPRHCLLRCPLELYSQERASAQALVLEPLLALLLSLLLRRHY